MKTCLKKSVALVLISLLSVSLASCEPATQPDTTPPTTVSPTATATPTGTPTTTTTPEQKKTTSVTIYQSDSQCQELVAKTIEVPVDNQIEEAVGKIIEPFDSREFDIAGYRVLVDENTNTATVDFRLSPDTVRRFVSLSSCESFALFGSLEKTLTSNPEWNIKSVKFTEQGKEIVL